MFLVFLVGFLLFFAIVTAALVTMIPLLYYWGLLGFNY